MKPLILFTIAASGLMLASCSKDGIERALQQDEIVLAIMDRADMGTHTKTTALTTLPSTLNWSGTTGQLKNETLKWGSSEISVTSGMISTGKYQTAEPTAYNYYVSTEPIVFGSDGSYIKAENSSDVVAGCTDEATIKTDPSIILEHVFARTGTLSYTPESGYEASDVSWTIESGPSGSGGIAGTYNIASRVWTDTSALPRQALDGFSDLYCIPGEYTVTVRYTLSKGDYSETNTVSGSIVLAAGKVNHISCTLPVRQGGAQEITIGVSLASWGSNPLTLIL